MEQNGPVANSQDTDVVCAVCYVLFKRQAGQPVRVNMKTFWGLAIPNQ